MLRQVLERLTASAILIVALSAASFGLLSLMPGDPIDLIAGADPRVTPEDIARLKQIYGVDQPFLERWLGWLSRALSGELGYSRMFAAPVGDVLAPALWRTLLLVTAALALSTVIGVAAGTLAALRPRSWFDQAASFTAFAGIAAPSFWLALMGMALFSVVLGWLPASATPADPEAGALERLRHLLMPIGILAILGTAGIFRHARGAVGEALSRQHVLTAEAKGLGRGRVVWAHVLPGAMIPLATVLALDLGALVSGALVVEVMFAYPGMGKLLFDAVMGADYNLAMAALLLGAVAIVAANALADIAYALLDPRIAFGASP